MIPRKLLRGDKFTSLYDLWNQMIDHLYEIRPVAGSGIQIQRMPAGMRFSATARGGSSGSGGSFGDLGPFAVTLEVDAETKKQSVKMHNSASDGEIAGLVTIGSSRFEIKNQEWAPAAGIVFCDITCNAESGEYQVLFSLAEKLPETTDEKRYILRLAEVTCDKDQKTYSVAQIRAVGDIEVLGRWVK